MLFKRRTLLPRIPLKILYKKHVSNTHMVHLDSEYEKFKGKYNSCFREDRKN